MISKAEAIKYLTQLTERPMTDQQLADKLGMHRVSWLRIKSGRAPVNDKFMVRVNQVFPQLGVFSSNNVNNKSKDASDSNKDILLQLSLPKGELKDIDNLVTVGKFDTRINVVKWLVTEGIKANRTYLDKAAYIISQIERLKKDL